MTDNYECDDQEVEPFDDEADRFNLVDDGVFFRWNPLWMDHIPLKDADAEQ